MKFNKLRIYLLLNLILIGFVCGKFLIVDKVKEKSNQNSEFKENSQETDLDKLKLSELELPDKVYTFFSGPYSLIFEDIYLNEEYMYHIQIELVTPHNVTNMDISIWDPDGKKFHVFESKMFYNPKDGRYFDIPYGTVMSGDYTFRFDSTSDYNYNLYIKIEEGTKCLYDQIEKPENIISQDCSRFYYGNSIHHIKSLKTDVSYIIFIGRVSAIAITENFEVRLDCTIYDKNGVPFIIYEKDLLVPMGVYYVCPKCEHVLSVDFECPVHGPIHPHDAIKKVGGHNQFNFGTAIDGEYDIKIRIYCNVEYVNVAYAIYRDYQISEIQDVNNTKAPTASSSSTTEDTIEKIENSIPFEWLIGIPIFIGVILGVSCVALLKIKRRGAPDIGIKK